MCSEHACQTNISNLGCAINCQQDVGRLEIQVHHIVAVQEVQTLGDVQSYASTPVDKHAWPLSTVINLVGDAGGSLTVVAIVQRCLCS